MKIQKNDDGYCLWLSVTDTENWANKAGAKWPCSQLSGNRVFVAVDENGLYDFTMNDKSANVDNNELTACIADHLSDDCRKFWPCWDW